MIELTRDAQARITTLTDPLGRTVRYTYTSAGDLETVTDPGGITTYTYDSAGRLLTITDPRGILFLRNEYDNCHPDAYYPPIPDAYFPPSEAQPIRRGTWSRQRDRLV